MRAHSRPIKQTVITIGMTIFLLAGVACQPESPVPPTAQPVTATPVPATVTPLPPRLNLPYTPVPPNTLSPVIIQRTPESGERLDPAGAIEIIFDRAMDKKSVEGAFRLSPPIVGSFAWKDTRSVSFKPSDPLPRNAVIDVALAQDARAADGAMLREPYQFRFATQGNLEVGQTIPADGARDVHPATIVTVMFNRPVVPLTTLNEQANLPQPLRFDPPLEGASEWLNTSILVFRPAQPLPGGVVFTGRISADLKDLDGNPLAQEYTWSFSTSTPKVIGTQPDPQSPAARVDTAITVAFSQDVDVASVQAAFTLRDGAEQPMPGQLVVLSNTLVFTPEQRLAFEALYNIHIAAGIKSRYGGLGSAEEYNLSFRTVPLPKVIGVSPADGDKNAYPGTPIIIHFNTEIDPGTVMSRIRMTPAFSYTQVYTYYNEYDHSFMLYFGAQPATDYAVEIFPGISDPYGNLTSESLRVAFRTRDLEPSAYVAAPSGIATLNAYLPARLVATTVNVGRLDLELTQYEAADPRSILRDQTVLDEVTTRPVRKWQQAIKGQANRVTRTLLELASGDGLLEPGAYMLRITSPDLPIDQYQQRIVLIVSRLNLTLKSEPEGALVWATDLQTGRPVGGVPVTFYRARYTQKLETERVDSVTTDSNGVAQVKLSASPDSNGYSEVLAIASEPYAAIGSSWSSGIGLYDFDLTRVRFGGYYDSGNGLKAHAYTDRAIYRPGQVVYLRGVARADDDVKYSLLPAGASVTLRVYDVQGKTIFDRVIAPDAYGAFSAEVTLAPGSPLGVYNITAETESRSLEYVQFSVSAYRAPEYEVTVTPEKTEIARGNTLNATINARYLSGGALRNTRVEWNVVANGAPFDPPQLDEYTFSDQDDPWYCFDCWRYISAASNVHYLTQGNGVTDDAGQLRVSLPISLELRDSSSNLISGPVSISIEGVAMGADNQAIAGRSSVMVHPADYYLGIAFTDYLIKAGTPTTVELVAVDWLGQRLANKQIEVVVSRREWTNTYNEAKGQWSYETRDIPVVRFSAVSDADGEARVTFTPLVAGTFRVSASGRDDAGREVRSSRFTWVTGDQYVPWLRENNDRINLVSNKATYTPGETAEILIPSPFQGAHYALVTVERGHILQHEVIPIESSTQVYRLPLNASHAPNVFVSVVLFSGMQSAGPSTSSVPGRADFKVGFINLEVLPTQQTLSVTLTPDRSLVQPGESVTYTLHAEDSTGAPVVGQFSLDLVDKGILNLMPRTANAIVKSFYGQRGTRVQTASGLSISANRIVEEEQKLVERQSATVSKSAQDNAAMPAATAAAAQPTAGEAPSAAGRGGASPAEVAPVRQNFADTAYWSPAVTTDAAGNAIINIKLPDNLTTWVLRAVGVDVTTRVGEGLVDIVATKPLLIRPVTPRFFVVGDVVTLGAVVNNTTDSTQTAIVSLSEAQGIEVTSPISQEVTILAGGQASVKWQATVGQTESVSLVFSVANAQYNDASRPRITTAPNGALKVNRYSAPEVVGTAGQLEQGGSRSEIIALPPRLDVTQGELTVRLDPSLAASMQAGLTYLENYPDEHPEAVLSRFLPNVLNYQALREFGIRDAALDARLVALVRDSLVKLYLIQNDDGGWSWWRGMESSPHISAYVVFGMLRAQQAGFEVEPGAIERGLAYLQGALVATDTLRQYYEYNRQAFVLYVLSANGRADAEMVSQLYDARDRLSLYARAVLALTIGNANPKDERLKTLFADLNARVIQSATGAHWEETNVDWWAMNTDTRSTAIILSALAQFDSGNQLAPNVARWLMMARRGDIWNTSQETAWSLIALTDWVRATGELRADYEFAALLNDKPIAEGQATQQTITQTTVVNVPVADLLRDVGNRLTILRGDGPGRLYYTAHLKAYLPVPSIKAADRGIAVQRKYTLASCVDGVKCPAVTSVRVGDVIRVSLTLIAPSELYYVRLEDPIPAGVDIVDTNLATTSQLAQGAVLNRVDDSPYRWWWYWYSHTEMRDDRVVLYAGYLSHGTYEYSYTFRATSAGQFNVLPAFANEQYFPEVFGRSDGMLMEIGD